MLSDPKRKPRRPSRPAIEALEGRVVLTTFHVANVAQLQSALTAVNNTSGPNTIDLAPGIYNVKSELRVQNAGNLTIHGTSNKSGFAQLIGNNQDRILEIDGGNVDISDVTLSGGGKVVIGGGIYAQNANLTLTDSAVVNNTATQAGGGIAVQGGSLTTTNTWVGNNGIFGGGDTFGGGIAAVNAQISLNKTSITNNSIASSNLAPQAPSLNAYGGGIYTQNGTLAIKGGTIANNMVSTITANATALSAGGGMATSSTIASIHGTTIQNNTLNASGHQLNTFQGNAFATYGGSLTITNTAFYSKSGAKIQFYQAGATVTLKQSSINGKKYGGTYILGDNGFTPQK